MPTFFRGCRARAALSAMLVLAAAPAPCVAADEPAPAAALMNEVVVLVRKPGTFGVELETTVFKPDGAGPFPVAIINHGKAPGDPLFQERARYTVAAREFVRRGYAVVVPMRQGFAGSGGRYVDGGCNLAGNARYQADDIEAVIGWLRKQPWADTTRMVVLGQSHGGLTTLAFGTRETSGVRRFGAAALDLAWVAAGRFDAYWERDIQPWDMAAGLLMVKEAGGIVSDLDGGTKMLETGDVLAGNGTIQKLMLAMLKAS